MNPEQLVAPAQKAVVPFSVDPYIGWKALQLTKAGLFSPTYDATWPPLRPLEARCAGVTEHNIYKWAPIASNAPQPIADDQGGTMPLFLTPGGEWASQPPEIELPPGYSWGLEQTITPIVSEYCNCGIYAVDDPDDCNFYLGLNKDNVLVQVALWGRLIRGENGARGEYAYPQQIVLPPEFADRAEQVQALYQVPVIVNPLPRAKVNTKKKLGAESDSKHVKPGFQHMLVLLSLATIAMITALSVSIQGPAGFVVFLGNIIPISGLVELMVKWDE